ncbi:histidine kinase dimerization/phospho-acceptor domain-containing protein [uncultured Erythrobacter sp.]|uniref:histidine kinase dimerization/phospho-acceptor domain-containing protein n=1 Tax=uncultured Erythrobacter sp. TaxID=263913 RepID=UPI00262AF348|nr:histidine kinase dimerization/phospho-acceptor domain-containing protein [uncultured Erythrobacter sp.]
MFFDDRLATVLRQRADSDVGRRTQFRQLLDILGAVRTGEAQSRDSSLVASAWLRMDALGETIPSESRARIIREAGWRFRNPELAAHLADFEPDVASAALNRAQLTAEDWSALIPRLPIRARGFLRLRRDLPVDVEQLLERLGVSDRGLPSPVGIPEEAPAAAPDTQIEAKGVDAPPSSPEEDEAPDYETSAPPPSPPIGIDVNKHPPHDVVEPQADAPTPSAILPSGFDPAGEGRSEISALVERIAAFKRNRESGGSSADDATEPRLPLGEEQLRSVKLIGAFGFAADAAGRIEWSDGETPAMVIGTRLAARPRLGASASETPLERAFARRQPIAGERFVLSGAEAIAGEWIVNAQPRFTDDGNFAGYLGRFRRPAGADPTAPSAAELEADRIRQLLHELRTPVTAVQGYAEVIQQQLFGTAPHEYRALAAAIAADAARILSGFEELDRLAKLETGVIEFDPGETDLAGLARRTASQLAQVLAPRMAGIEFDDADIGGAQLVALDSDQAEGLLWRLLATLGGGCAAGEMLEASLLAENGMARLTCDLPAQLLAEEDIFTAEAKPVGNAVNAGLFGAGFALRLARAEARAAGGSLTRDDERIVLNLPLLETAAMQPDMECEASGEH